MRLMLPLCMLITFLALGISSGFAAEKLDYKTGDTLKKQSKNVYSSKDSYKSLNWDELIPADWDPLQPLKGLDLDRLNDDDPRTREALFAIGEAWKNAPIIPGLNGQRVKIAGFVVPLDVNKKKVKEFLLVPYFGACIHVPPPPSNQVVHAINAKVNNEKENEVLKKAALIQGPITLGGIIQTSSSDTAMGSAGYRIQVEAIEEYKD
jgi:uncharacterized protein